jgi:hypothetical protein
MEMEDFFARLEKAPKVDFEKIGKSVLINDTRSDNIELDMDHQNEMVHAAMIAVRSMNLPKGYLGANFYEEEKSTQISQSISAFHKGSSSLLIEDQDIVLNNAAVHTISVSIAFDAEKNGNTHMQIKATHDGAYNKDAVDTSSAVINYTIDAEGNFTKRNGSALSQDRSVDVESQAHGKWVMQAAQALESNFAAALGGEAQEQIKSQRPPGAATKADAPPMAENMTPLSSVNLKALTQDAKPADAPAQPLKFN